MENWSISPNFTFDEFEHSSTAEALGIKNEIPNETIRKAIRLLVSNILQPLRDALGKPLVINSGYRSPELNIAVGGSKNSQHLRGEAADIASEDPMHLVRLIKENNLPFDQIIVYANFVHISYSSKGSQRMRIIYNK